MASEGQSLVGNMIVPIELLPPILDDLMRFGRVDQPPRPWLGLFATDTADGVVVTGVAPGGPAARAGLTEGDAVTALNGQEIEDLGDLWRKLWAQGPAGIRSSSPCCATAGPRRSPARPPTAALHEAPDAALTTHVTRNIF